ncbi:MAG TPA: peptidoglycan DD-metalloendopeptidase family protein [Caulobacteraceae bacterium]|jgi:murein DD-endopeptidase MepM/ murein hydrolase activator NlpD|nr:peptidoglycan DD-metalloendopeptidase family protein [Caulobacteraceae bacterium]
MGDDADDPVSFNPSDWRRKAPGKAAPSDAAGLPATPRPPGPESAPEAVVALAATTSFNPREWAATADASARAPAAPAPGSTADAPPPPPRSRRALLIGAGSAGGLVAVGAAAWWLTRGRSNAGGKEAELASAPAAGAQRRALTVRSPSDISSGLLSAGVSAADADAASRAALAHIPTHAGDLTLVMMIQPSETASRLASLDARYEDGAGVVVTAAPGGGFAARPTAADLRTVLKVVRGEMDAFSFYTSAVAQHLTDSLISPFAQALAFDFDFQREIRQGDVFEAAFEDRENAKGESVGVGRLLYVSMQTRDKSRALYWFQPPGGDGGWFDANGRSVVRALMRTPIEGARISSTFGMREHPVLGFMKMHKGVDFAAPIGTPIYAAGDGAVLEAQFKELDGNYVKIQHADALETIYLHMSAFGPGIAAGVRVRQGQQIGAVGTTGRSTGPHLHYEVHQNNVPVDPMSVQSQSQSVKPLDGPAMANFVKERDRIDVLRASQTG